MAWRKMLVVVKMRGSAHAIDMVEYQITDAGVVIGEPLRGYRGLTTGIPEPWSPAWGTQHPEPRRDRAPTGVAPKERRMNEPPKKHHRPPPR